jgi:hypothetical protein
MTAPLASADGSASKGGPASIGVAVAINTATGTLRASVANSAITSDGLTVAARVLTTEDDDQHAFSASATSGASGGNVGVAGAVAVNLAGLSTQALLIRSKPKLHWAAKLSNGLCRIRTLG